MLGTVRASWLPMNAPASKANQLERGLISFGAAILALSGKLPRTPQGRHICGQILRPEPPPLPMMAKRVARKSRADFIQKLKVVFKELNETTIWLEMIGESRLLPTETIVAIVAEN